MSDVTVKFRDDGEWKQWAWKGNIAFTHLGHVVSVEQLYQMFKKRMTEELPAIADPDGHYFHE